MFGSFVGGSWIYLCSNSILVPQRTVRQEIQFKSLRSHPLAFFLFVVMPHKNSNQSSPSKGPSNSASPKKPYSSSNLSSFNANLQSSNTIPALFKKQQDKNKAKAKAAKKAKENPPSRTTMRTRSRAETNAIWNAEVAPNHPDQTSQQHRPRHQAQQVNRNPTPLPTKPKQQVPQQKVPTQQVPTQPQQAPPPQQIPPQPGLRPGRVFPPPQQASVNFSPQGLQQHKNDAMVQHQLILNHLNRNLNIFEDAVGTMQAAAAQVRSSIDFNQSMFEFENWLNEISKYHV